MSGEKFHVEQPAAKWRLEIRCCCNPDRVYGWLELDGEPQIGRRLVFPVPPMLEHDGQVVDRGEVRLEFDRVTVPGELHFDDPRREFRTYLALKYAEDHRTFEEKARRLAHVRGFTPSAQAALAIKSDPNRSNQITRASR